MRSFSDASARPGRLTGYMEHETGGRLALAPPPADWIDERPLAANVAQRHAIPAGAAFVLFSSSGDFRAKYGDASVVAAIAGGAVTDGSASELNPAARALPEGVTHISMIAPATATVTLSFYRW